jgi:hypothetical protein
MSLYPTIVRPGAVLVCRGCWRRVPVTAEWLANVRERHFPKRIHDVLYEEDVRRLKCSTCGGRDTRVVDPPLTEAAPASGGGSWGDIPFYPDWRDQG